MATSKDLWSSDRLVYRAAESPGDDDFFFQLKSNAQDVVNTTDALPKPSSRADVKRYLDAKMNHALIAVVICLKPETKDAGAIAVPIGICRIWTIEPSQMQHRNSNIGLHISPAYQGKGYGSEAIRWLVNWGFESAGLHRIGIGAFEYNKGAVALYQRLGFQLEGRRREAFYHAGRWWDDIQMGMLEHEWREIKKTWQ